MLERRLVVSVADHARPPFTVNMTRDTPLYYKVSFQQTEGQTQCDAVQQSLSALVVTVT